MKFFFHFDLFLFSLSHFPLVFHVSFKFMKHSQNICFNVFINFTPVSVPVRFWPIDFCPNHGPYLVFFCAQLVFMAVAKHCGCLSCWLPNSFVFLQMLLCFVPGHGKVTRKWVDSSEFCFNSFQARPEDTLLVQSDHSLQWMQDLPSLPYPTPRELQGVQSPRCHWQHSSCLRWSFHGLRHFPQMCMVVSTLLNTQT